ncbi:hypothetical protein BDD14_2622 [Edaphobacter modestus]|uniref:Uncharacterized protein n=1 Tax=Edaphobacter modestus TaxID=388466 RepID=A0A4Q7YUX1_9BACT|nr:hypothetical protein BDD14_2622 [Edaphobacter modestus]
MCESPRFDPTPPGRFIVNRPGDLVFHAKEKKRHLAKAKLIMNRYRASGQ